MICPTLGNTSGRTECCSVTDSNHLQRLRICAKIIQRVIDLYNSKQYIDCAQPCSKLCEPSLKEGVEEVDVDDDIDEGESVADEVGKSIPGICF